MRFHGRKSWIRCLAHITSLICEGVLQDLKAGTAKEAKKMLDKWDEENKSNNYTIPGDSSRSGIAKISLLNLWMLRSGPREQDFKSMPRTHHRQPTYDVDTRWNSTYDMIDQFLELEAEYTEFVDTEAPTEPPTPKPLASQANKSAISTPCLGTMEASED